MLGNKTASSGIMMVAARLISRSIDLVTLLILARLLTPKDFGLVAIAATIILVLEAALELPLSQALVRLDKIEDSYYDTAFTLALLRGGLIIAIVAALAVPVADFYQHAALTPLIMTLSLGPAARGLLNPRMAQYAKDMNFKYEFMFELGAKVVAFSGGLTVALLTHSYWSLAIGQILGPIVTSLLSYIMFPFRPRLTLSDWRVFSSFLGWISLSQIVLAINFQSDQLLLGKLMPTRQLGMFSLANNITIIPIAALFGPLLRPLLSAFTMLRDDKERLRSSYLNASVACVAIGMPLLTGLSMVAEPMVKLMLGTKWIGAIVLVKWLAISLIPYLFGMLITPISMALGETRQMLSRNIFQMVVKLPMVIFGAIKYGFAGVIAARLVSEMITSLYCMMIVQKITGLTVARQLLSCTRCILATVAMAIALAILNRFFASSMDLWTNAVQLTIAVSIGIVTYTGFLLLFWRVAGRPAGFEAIAMRTVMAKAGRFGWGPGSAVTVDPADAALRPDRGPESSV